MSRHGMQQHQRDERGSASLELAVLVPVLMLLIFGALQVTLYFYGRSAALAAAQEGARVAATETGTAGAGQSAADDFATRAAGDFIQGRTISSNRGAGTVTVTVTGRALSILPGVTGQSFSQTASLPVERVT